jgi:GWxTD domain-containing protein
MKTKLLLIIGLLNLFIITDLFSQEKFIFDYDYCIFKSDNSKVYVEFYYAFSQNKLLFVKNENGFEADGLIFLDLFEKTTDKAKIMKSFKVPVLISDTAGYNKNAKLIGQLNILIEPGKYKLNIFAADFNDTTKNVKIHQDITIDLIADNTPASSEIQFATDIKSSNDTKNLFYKNTLEVVPNPSRLFGNNLAKLFYYIELYNLKKELITDEFIVNTSITDLNGSELVNNSKKVKLKNESRVEFGDYSISSLKTGSYKMVLQVLDAQNNLKIEQKKQFWVYNTDTSKFTESITDQNFLNSEYAAYTEEQVNTEFNQAIYLITDKFKNEFEKITTLEVKRKVLYEFWKRLDSNPLTPVNETKVEYFKRINYANQNYKNDYFDGWKSDRGRVYIVYGPPDNIDRYPYQAGTRAYEIWTYDKLEGGVEFVFIDISNNFTNYILVHSSARNELSDENWRTRLNIKR